MTYDNPELAAQQQQGTQEDSKPQALRAAKKRVKLFKKKYLLQKIG